MLVRTSVLVVGAYGVGNLGDDALLVSVLKVIRQVVGDNEICVLILRPGPYLGQWYPDIRFIPLQSGHRICGKVLIYGGGTQFYSFRDSTPTKAGRILRASRYLVHPLKLWRRLHHCTFDFEHAIGVSIGIGPLVPGSFPQKQADKKLKSCDWISVRDSVSVQYCRNLGRDNVHQYSDLCFARRLWDEAPTRGPRTGEMNRVGVVVRDWPHTREGQSYFGKVKETVRKLRREEIEIRYISFAPQADSETLSDLNSNAEDILQWDPSQQTLRTFIEELVSFDLLISARAHGVIMGTALGIPSIAIEVEPKLRLICDKLTSGTRIWSPPFEPDELVQKVMSMKDNWQEHCYSIFSEGAVCASEAITSTEALKTYLKQVLL